MKEKYESLSAKLLEARQQLKGYTTLLELSTEPGSNQTSWSPREWNLLCDTANMLSAKVLSLGRKGQDL